MRLLHPFIIIFPLEATVWQIQVIYLDKKTTILAWVESMDHCAPCVIKITRVHCTSTSIAN